MISPWGRRGKAIGCAVRPVVPAVPRARASPSWPNRRKVRRLSFGGPIGTSGPAGQQDTGDAIRVSVDRRSEIGRALSRRTCGAAMKFSGDIHRTADGWRVDMQRQRRPTAHRAAKEAYVGGGR
jgi:hypothetical protein